MPPQRISQGNKTISKTMDGLQNIPMIYQLSFWSSRYWVDLHSHCFDRFEGQTTLALCQPPHPNQMKIPQVYLLKDNYNV